MFPLYDQFRIPGKKGLIVPLLIASNTFLFLLSLSDLESFIFKYGLIPQRIFQGQDFFTLFSSMFFHANFWHLFGNMWFLWVFGENLEKRLGRMRFLIFYLLAGIFAALFYLILASQKTIPAVGASGAISGVLGGYLIAFPGHRIVSLVPIFFFFQLIAIPTFFFIGLWFFYQLLSLGTQTMVGYWAHIAGFLVGIFLIKIFLPKKEANFFEKE